MAASMIGVVYSASSARTMAPSPMAASWAQSRESPRLTALWSSVRPLSSTHASAFDTLSTVLSHRVAAARTSR